MKKTAITIILLALVVCGMQAIDPGSFRGSSVSFRTLGEAYYDSISGKIVLTKNDSSNKGDDCGIQLFIPAAIGQADTIDISINCSTSGFSGHGAITFSWLGVAKWNENISGTSVSHTFTNQSADQTPIFRIWVTGIAPEQGERIYVDSATFTINGQTQTVVF
jgi:hypothetical protein